MMRSHDTDHLKWIQEWFSEQCNEGWEHGDGIVIESMDNPGWRISIGLENTLLQEREFHLIDEQRSDDDWILCRVNKNKFESFGASGNLVEILEVFRQWASNNDDLASD